MGFVSRDKYRFYACLLRARFDENKSEKDLVKATMLLKAGEEEFWTNQHPQPYLFPDSPGGTSYERYDCYKVRPGKARTRPEQYKNTRLDQTAVKPEPKTMNPLSSVGFISSV